MSESIYVIDRLKTGVPLCPKGDFECGDWCSDIGRWKRRVIRAISIAKRYRAAVKLSPSFCKNCMHSTHMPNGEKIMTLMCSTCNHNWDSHFKERRYA